MFSLKASNTPELASYRGRHVGKLLDFKRQRTVGKMDKDQVEGHATRKGMELGEAEKWLSTNLGYEAG